MDHAFAGYRSAVTITLAVVLRVVAVVCFAIALLLTLGAFDGGNAPAWGYGGLLALAGSFLP